MKADIFFPNVEVYDTPDGQTLRVRVGEQFRVVLKEVGDGVIQWATTKDPVLKLDDNGEFAVVIAERVGSSEVQIQRERAVVHYITIDVYGTEAQGFNVPAPTVEANA